MAQTFDNLMLLGRPASGKSEFIDFMKNIDPATLAEKYHLGKFEFVDDFVWLWEMFEEDDIWEKIGKPRLYSKIYEGHNYGLIASDLLDFCMEKFNVEITKYISKPEFYNDHTLFVEFARGGENGYHHALSSLTKEVLEKSSILFILVSFEESCRRNNARYEQKLQHSILAHKVPDETLNEFYSTHDWLEITDNKPDGFLNIKGVKIPFVTMSNQPELTDPVLLDQRYAPAMKRLMELNKQR